MSYNSPIASTAKGVAKDSPLTTQRAQNTRDLLMFVDSYDTTKGVIRGTQVSDGKRFEVSIDPKRIVEGRALELKLANQPEPAPYYGHAIDARMAKSIAPDGRHIAVLHEAQVMRVLKQKNPDDGTLSELRLVQAKKVSNGGVNPTKTFEALITMTKSNRFNNVDRIQAWKPTAINADDAAALGELAATFDASSEAYQTAQSQAQDSGAKTASYPPLPGFELRTIQVNPNPAAASSIIDLSGPMERTSAKYDGNNVMIHPSRPLSGADVKQIVEDYSNYVKAEYGEGVRVEVTNFVSYPTGRFDKGFDFSRLSPSGYSPYLKMATARSKRAKDDDVFQEGQNYACWAVLELAKDKTDPSGAVIPQNFVNHAHIGSNKKGFIHRKIFGAKKELYDFDKALQGDLLMYSAPKTDANTNPSQSLAKPSLSGATQPSDIDDDIPFGSDDASLVGGASTTSPVATFQGTGRSSGANSQWADDEDLDIPFDGPAVGTAKPKM
jgi:hypothetical protein